MILIHFVTFYTTSRTKIFPNSFQSRFLLVSDKEMWVVLEGILECSSFQKKLLYDFNLRDQATATRTDAKRPTKECDTTAYRNNLLANIEMRGSAFKYSIQQ